MIVLGLTGKYCSGKSVIAFELEKQGFYHIDVDKLGHFALEEKKGEIEKTFGNAVISTEKDGTVKVDRKALGAIVFSDRKKKKLLESIVHPAMAGEVARIVEKECKRDSNSKILINAAILAQMNLHKLCTVVIWVKTPFFVRFKRALKRDNLGFFAVLKRIISQRNLTSNLTKKYVDTYIVNNYGETNSPESVIDRILKLIDLRN